MTICPELARPVEKRLVEKKNLEQIGKELCKGVKDPRDKALRLVEMFKGKEYLKKNASWLGYDVSHIRNPNGNRNRQKTFSQKDKQVEAIKKLLKKQGDEPDKTDVTEELDGTLKKHENIKEFQKKGILNRPFVWEKYQYNPTIEEVIQSADFDYDNLLNIIDIAVKIVTKKNIDGWQDIEDIVNSRLQLDERVWQFNPLNIHIFPEEEKHNNNI